MRAAVAGAATLEETPPPGWHTGVTLHTYSPWAAKWELADRLLAPTTVDRLRAYEQRAGRIASEHTIELAKERYDLLVPARRPPNGYGLLVFVAPGPRWSLPRGWKAALDARGIVLVTAHGSGNDQPVYDRRIPLALHAVSGVRARMPVDRERIYVGGFSGGGRVAQRLATAFPDVFRGALLLAGSEPFGGAGLFGQPWSPPRRAWMERLRMHSRLVLVSGGLDLVNRAHDARTAESLRSYCVAGVTTQQVARMEHWVPERRHFERALALLETPPDVPDAVRRCVAAMDRTIEAELDRVEALLDAGRPREAGVLLGEIEDRYGGLAEHRSVTLARRVAAALGSRDANGNARPAGTNGRPPLNTR